MDHVVVITVLSAVGTISAITLGWIGQNRIVRQSTRNDAGNDAALKTDVDYIKRGVDDMRLEQRVQGQRFDQLAERVTRVEESAKQAHLRLDRSEKPN
ncbi:hypothetical protein AB4Z17_25935 [Paenibacillus sp. TAF43_2]|uniref:hypothetical protein n=1 Tax=Paenibacillus sp. TAF43_2 TaxID=3233069 RepID=UPI003F9B7D04